MKTIFTIFFSIIISTYCYADIKTEIEHLEIQKNNLNKREPLNLYNLPNKNFVNLNEWNLVIFMQSTCKYCLEFDPVIKKVADELGIKTIVFSFDGLSDGHFENVLPVTNEIVANFFRDLPVATPTTFLVNVDDLTTLPLSQGAMTKTEFENRIKITFSQRMGEGK